ncbi:MAG: DNA translocase FtsK [Fusobacteria bacterium]|nr:DNA translocase FtsK [Fusobacteriota bacterium]
MRNRIIGICLFAVTLYGFFILTSQFTEINTGMLGNVVEFLLSMFCGILSYVFLFILLGYSLLMIALKNIKIKKLKFIAIILTFITLSILLVIIQSSEANLHKNFINEFLRVGGSGNSGGMLGSAFLIVLYPYLGTIGIYICDSAILIISLLILFEEALKNSIINFWSGRSSRREARTALALERGKAREHKMAVKFERDLQKQRKKEKSFANTPIEKHFEVEDESVQPIQNVKKRDKIVTFQLDDMKGMLKEPLIKGERQKISLFELDDKPQTVDKKSTEMNTQGVQVRIKPPQNLHNTNDKESLEKVSVNDIFDEKRVSKVDTEKERLYYLDKIIKLEGALAQYGIAATVVNYEVGPVITRFELSIEQGVRVKRVSSLSDDIAMILEAKSIRIEAPIPGKNLIGIEVPNGVAEPVYFSEIVKDKAFQDSTSELSVILGKDIIGKNVVIDLKKMPHLLIAGRTGSGKSVGINTLISSILLKSGPDKVRFIMVDPKMVELMPYNDIKHLLVPVITEPKLAAVALRWAVNEMEERYKKLSALGVRNIEGYNGKNVSEFMYYIVIIIDEFADLMMVAPGTLEESIARIAQKARAVGIHLVMATQRPSTDVITGTIKANLPSRISFSVASQIDSRTILDQTGAEKLLGKGDMLYSESSSPNLVRIQGAFISDDEVIKLTEHLKKLGEPNYNEEIISETTSISGDVDDMYDQAVALLEGESKVSTSYLQRKLKVGYSRAARIIDQLQENGIINDNKEVM